MKTITFETKAGQNINEVINSKANAKDLSFRIYCHLQDYKSFKKLIK